MHKDHISLADGGWHPVWGDTQIGTHVGSLDVA